MALELKTPKLYAEHLPEPHRTVNADGTVSEVELPGFIVVGVELNGVRKALARFKAGEILDDLKQLEQSKGSSK